MDLIESKLKTLLRGDSVNDEGQHCDFSLEQQNEATAAQGVKPSSPSQFVPIVKQSVTYIVMAVLFNEDNEVLLMQEAKRSCAGQWYLPAGRMEPGENILDAVKREVLEETGLILEPTSLITVDAASKAWFRFIFTGRITGGVLKTPGQADSESLQAKWVKDINELTLRANDIVSIIEKALEHKNTTEPHYPPLIPALKAHSKLLLRLIICIKQKSSNRVHVLLSEKNTIHFPTCEIHHMKNLHSTLRKFMVDIFGADVPAHKPHGVLSVEHCAKGATTGDGICITVLVSFRVPLEEVYPINKFTWLMISKDVGTSLLGRLPRNMTVPLNVIR